jgi:hypothetical protein
VKVKQKILGKKSAKQKAVAAWIWIVGTTMLGLIVFVAGSAIFINISEVQEKNAMLEKFADFASKVKVVCTEGGIGEVYHYPAPKQAISVSQVVRAIYVANESDELAPDKVSLYIAKNRSATGKYLCLQFFDESDMPKCSETDCTIQMNYIGTPSKASYLANLVGRMSGSIPTYKYKIMITKPNKDFVLVETVATV